MKKDLLIKKLHTETHLSKKDAEELLQPIKQKDLFEAERAFEQNGILGLLTYIRVLHFREGMRNGK